MPAGTLTQPLKWPGGKNYLAKRIITMMPPHLVYCEPYFGGGAVLLQRDPNRDWMATGKQKLPGKMKGCSEVVNDVNGDLSNFWQVLQSPEWFPRFVQLCQVTPFSQAEYKRAWYRLRQKRSRPLSPEHIRDRIEVAWAFFVVCRQSRSGMMKDFATLTRNRTRAGINEQVSAWLSCVEGLPQVHARMINVVILAQKAISVILSQDDVNTLFYLDPPYMHDTRSTLDLYRFEMTDADHLELLQTIAGIKGKFLLSGKHCELYDRFAKQHGWNCIDIAIDNKLASGKKKQQETECVWSNFTCV